MALRLHTLVSLARAGNAHIKRTLTSNFEARKPHQARKVRVGRQGDDFMQATSGMHMLGKQGCESGLAHDSMSQPVCETNPLSGVGCT